MRRRFGALALLALGCSSASEPTEAPSASALQPGVVARVGSELVESATVARVAQQRALSASDAGRLAISDARFAAEARRRLPEGTRRAIERAATARALLEGLAHDAKALPPPTEAELDEVLRERWLDLDRPDAVRTTHAVVLNEHPEKAAAARLVAEKLGAALASAKTGAELIAAAQAFSGEGFEIRAESLPFVTVDGRVFVRTETGLSARPGGFDPAFAKGANAIPEVGQLGPIVESKFGFHLILLEERLPGVSTPRAGLATLLGPEVQARRGSKLRSELLAKLRGDVAIEVQRAADDLTARVKVAP